MKKIVLLALMCIGQSYVFGQHYFHTAFWSRIALNARLTPKLNFTGEIGVRRQNSLYHLNPAEKPQTNNVKLTFTYALKSLNLIISPYENIYSNALLGKEDDLKLPRTHELRFSGGVELIKKWERRRLQFRNIYEYRIFDTAVRHRLRSRLVARHMLTPKTTLSVLDEVFINTSPNRTPNLFNQNRLSCTVSHSLTQHFEFEVGYIYALSERITLTEFDHTNGLIVYFTVKL